LADPGHPRRKTAEPIPRVFLNILVFSYLCVLCVLCGRYLIIENRTLPQSTRRTPRKTQKSHVGWAQPTVSDASAFLPGTRSRPPAACLIHVPVNTILSAFLPGTRSRPPAACLIHVPVNPILSAFLPGTRSRPPAACLDHVPTKRPGPHRLHLSRHRSRRPTRPRIWTEARPHQICTAGRMCTAHSPPAPRRRAACSRIRTCGGCQGAPPPGPPSAP